MVTKRHELSDSVPYAFPFVAVLRGEARSHKRVDSPVIVKGYAGMERHYFRIEKNGQHLVANDSMLYVEV